MKQVIDGRLYDTENAERIAVHNPVADRQDFDFFSETLYKTEKGNYFLHGEGGARTKYAERTGDGKTGGAKIRPMDVKEALQWCENREIDGGTVADEFGDHIENA